MERDSLGPSFFCSLLQGPSSDLTEPLPAQALSLMLPPSLPPSRWLCLSLVPNGHASTVFHLHGYHSPREILCLWKDARPSSNGSVVMPFHTYLSTKASFVSGHREKLPGSVYPLNLDSLHPTSSQDVLVYPSRAVQARGAPR